MNKFVNYVEVPFSKEENININNIKWIDNKCVMIIEEYHITYYAKHKYSKIKKYNNVGDIIIKDICRAVPIRLKIGDGLKELYDECPNEEIYSELLLLFVENNLDIVKQNIIKDIIKFDKSIEVNEFFYHNKSMWLNKDERMIIGDRFQRELNNNKHITNLIYFGEIFNITPQEGINLINAIKKYADECFDVTHKHINNINNIISAKELIDYNYKVGYPNKLYL